MENAIRQTPGNAEILAHRFFWEGVCVVIMSLSGRGEDGVKLPNQVSYLGQVLWTSCVVLSFPISPPLCSPNS